jgi:hypothetical protein
MPNDPIGRRIDLRALTSATITRGKDSDDGDDTVPRAAISAPTQKPSRSQDHAETRKQESKK